MDIETIVVAILSGFLSSIIAALATTLGGYWRERKLKIMEKAACVYDDCLKLFNEYRVDPGIALKEDFFFRLLGLSNMVRVYCSKDLVLEMQEFSNARYRNYYEYRSKLDALDKDWLSVEIGIDPETGSCTEINHPAYPVELYEEKRKSLEADYTETDQSALKSIKPILETIRKDVA